MEIDNIKLNKLANEIFIEPVVAFEWDFCNDGDEDSDEVEVSVIDSEFSFMSLEQKRQASHASFILKLEELTEIIKT